MHPQARTNALPMPDRCRSGLTASGESVLIWRAPSPSRMTARLIITCPTISPSSSATSAISGTYSRDDRIRSTSIACTSDPNAAATTR
jgi:hypothetical protein